jgi:hypothetical protein
MKLQYLYAEFIDKPDAPEKEVFGIALGDNQSVILFEVNYEEWYELLKNLSRKRAIILREGKTILPFHYRLKYFVEPKN